VRFFKFDVGSATANQVMHICSNLLSYEKPFLHLNAFGCLFFMIRWLRCLVYIMMRFCIRKQFR
ncbi:hypothetical protein CCACVL1_06337, partial [Corchorus capsularis]